ncbi:hypothetical protein D8Y20_10855 [Mariprofundus sp. EBB-1]|nr:hypothetical protein D8Y20_10855 [Mariprofundus sp. EBB-1]
MLFNAVVDPYGLFPLVKMEEVSWPKPEMVNSVKMHKSFKVAQVKPEAVVLGTSRAAFGIDPSSDAWSGTVQPRYNLALAGANIFVTRRFLEHAQILHPLKQVVFGLDFFAFNVFRQQAPDYRGDFLTVNDDGSQNRHFDMKIIAASLLSIDALQASYKTVTSKNKNPIMTSETGMFVGPIWKGKEHQSFMNMEKIYFQYVYLAGRKREYAFNRPDTGASSLKEFRKIVVYCREHNIDLRLFISPPHARHQEIIRVLGLWPIFEQWKRELVRILKEEEYKNPLWDFSGYNSMTTDDILSEGEHYYRDSTHYLPILGDMILSRIFSNNDQSVPVDFGRELTPENIEENLRVIRAEQKQYHVDYPDSAEEIASMAGKYGFDLQDLIIRLDEERSKARWFRATSRGTPISKALRDHERGMVLEKLCEVHGITKETFTTWKKLYDRHM